LFNLATLLLKVIEINYKIFLEIDIETDWLTRAAFARNRFSYAMVTIIEFKLNDPYPVIIDIVNSNLIYPLQSISI